MLWFLSWTVFPQMARYNDSEDIGQFHTNYRVEWKANVSFFTQYASWKHNKAWTHVGKKTDLRYEA